MEGIDVISITDLVKKADLRWKSEAKKRKEHQDQLKAKMEAALAEESGLIKELTAAKKTVAEMEKEFFELEKKVKKEQAKTVENMGISEADVLAGRATLRQFQARGISEKKKSDLIIEQTLGELEGTLNLIRTKKKKLLKRELKLAKLKKRVFSLSLYPGKVLIDALENQKDFLSREMTVLLADMTQSDSSVKLLEHVLHLTEGGGLSAGHRWTRLSFKEAEKIIFSPILPSSLIQDFKQQIQQFQDPEELINIVLSLPPGKDPSLDLSPAAGHGPKKQVIQTSKKIKSDKKNKSIQTRDLK